MIEPPSPRLSVIIATVDGWDRIRTVIERLIPQLEATDAELIVVDGSALPFPFSHDRLRRLTIPGADVFALRALALAEARGAILALTEDHCLPAPDWCAQILAAHEAHPDLVLIGGSVANGSPRRLIDWANFLITFSPFMRPVPSDRGSRIPPPANVSFKRAGLPLSVEIGQLEIALPERIQAEGRAAVMDSIEVAHVQSHGFFSTFRHHCDNGRATAGLALIGAPRAARRKRPWTALAAAPRLIAVTVRNTLRRGVPLRAKLSLPLLAIVVASHTVGEIVGSQRGPGRSPDRLS